MRVFQEKGGQLWGKEGGLRGDTNTKREWWYYTCTCIYNAHVQCELYMYNTCTCVYTFYCQYKSTSVSYHQPMVQPD